MARTNTLVGIPQLRNEANNILEALNPPIKPKEVGTLFNHIIDYLPLEGSNNTGGGSAITDNYITRIDTVPLSGTPIQIATVHPKTGSPFPLYAPESSGGTNLTAVWNALAADNPSYKIHTSHLRLDNIFNPLQNTLLQNFTWWGHKLGDITGFPYKIEGNLDGNINYIKFSNGVKIEVVLGEKTLKVWHNDGAANIYATGGVSALGTNSSGGGGGQGASLTGLLYSISLDGTYGINGPQPTDSGKALMWGTNGGSTEHWYFGDVGSIYSLPVANSDTLGGIKLGYTKNLANKTIPIELSSEKAYVDLSDFALNTELSDAIDTINTTLLNSYATQAWVDNNYISKAFFNELFLALDESGNEISPNNTSGIEKIKALHGLWTTEYLSALGINSDLPNNFIVAGSWAEFFNGKTYDELSTALGYLRLEDGNLSWSAGPAGGDLSSGVSTIRMSTDSSGLLEVTPISSLTGNVELKVNIKEGLLIPSSTAVTTLNLLSTGSATLFGNTYWDNGVPLDVGTNSNYADLQYVENIYMHDGEGIGNIFMFDGSNDNGLYFSKSCINWKDDSNEKHWVIAFNRHKTEGTYDYYICRTNNSPLTRIGIGLSSNLDPTELLDVRGNIRIDGTVLSWDSTSNSLKILNNDVPSDIEVGNLYFDRRILPSGSSTYQTQRSRTYIEGSGNVIYNNNNTPNIDYLEDRNYKIYNYNIDAIKYDGNSLPFKGSGAFIMQFEANGLVTLPYRPPIQNAGIWGYSDTYKGLRIGNGILTWESSTNSFKVFQCDGNGDAVGPANFYATGGVSALGIPNDISGSVANANITTLNSDNVVVGDYTIKKSETSTQVLGVTTYQKDLIIEADDEITDTENNSTIVKGEVKVTFPGVNATPLTIDRYGISSPRFYLADKVYLHYDSSSKKLILTDNNNNEEIDYEVGLTEITNG